MFLMRTVSRQVIFSLVPLGMYAPGPSPTEFSDASGHVRALLSPHPSLWHHSDSQRHSRITKFSEVP